MVQGPNDEKPVHAAARYSIIALDEDGARPSVDRYIKPEAPVVDFLTRVSGVTEADLRDITYGPKDVHCKIQQWFGPEKILVVHDGTNDIKMLNIVPGRVIDTALLFEHRFFGGSARPSLEWLMAWYFKESMDRKGGHCPVEDAQATGRLVKHLLKYGVLTECLHTKP